MKKTLKLIALIATFCIMFTGVPMLSGEMDASAASDQIKVTATCNGWTNTVALRWNKISNPEWGYAIVVNGKVYGHVTKTTSYYAVKKLRSGTKYSFRVRTWKKVRSKMYYNSSTKKWQWTDPGKKYCTKTNYGMRYVYGTCSNLVYATTAPAKYTIRYDANGGKGAPANGTKTQNKAYTVSKQIPTCDGFKFTGWLIVETNKIVSPGSTIAAGSNANYTLKAQWEAVPEYSTIIFRNYDGSTLQKNTIKSGTMPEYTWNTPRKSSDANYDYVFDGWNPPVVPAEGDADYTAVFKKVPKNGGSQGGGGIDTPTPGYERVTLTNYRGETTEVLKANGKYYKNEDFLEIDRPMKESALILIDRTIDGEFTDNNGTWIQKNGVTFNKNDLVNQTKPSNDSDPATLFFKVAFYGGDPEKLEYEIVNPIRTVSSYNYKMEPTDYEYITLNGKNLVQYYGEYTEINGRCIRRELLIGRLAHSFIRCGFVNGDINIRIKYDGEQIGSITYNPCKNDGDMYSERQKYLDIDRAAIEANGGPKSFQEDLNAIERYIYNNYTYDEMNCIDGFYALETWSIYQYGVTGFSGPGVLTPDDSAYGPHSEFHLDSDPTIHYSAQGHH